MSDNDEETKSTVPEVDYVKQHDAALKAVSDAKRKYNLDIASANTDVVKAKAKYQARIDKATRELEKIKAAYSTKVASYFGMTLYKDRITDGEKEFLLTDGVKVRIETKGAIVTADGSASAAAAGSEPAASADASSSAAVAAAVGGVSAVVDRQADDATGAGTVVPADGGNASEASASKEASTSEAADETVDESATILEPEVIEHPDELAVAEPAETAIAPAEVNDTRELFLHVESNSDSFSVKCDPDKGEEAKHFMQQITDMVATAKDRDDEKNAKLAECNAKIEAIRNDTAAVDDAKAKLENITNDTSAISAAQEALRTLEFNASIDQKTAYAMRVAHKAKMEKVTIAVVIAVIIIVLAIVILLVNRG